MIVPVTRQLILEGTGEWTPCYMFGIRERSKWFRCDMWLEILDEVEGVGYIPYVDGRKVGQMFFLPKKYARRIGLPTCRANDDLEKTMVIGCLMVLKEYMNRGFASAMIGELMVFCKGHGYTRIEACIDPRPPEEAGINTSFLPFRKFGFTIDEDSSGWEFRPETRMCSCYL